MIHTRAARLFSLFAPIFKGLSVIRTTLLLACRYVADVERGNRNISLLNIELISKGLKMSLSELFKGI